MHAHALFINHSNNSIALIFILAFLLGRLGELLLPARIRLRGVDVGEDEGEDVRVPVDGLAFDAFFDVLS